MSNPTTMQYGSYDFGTQGGPIPFLTINKTFNRAEDGTKLGSRLNITVDGTLTPLPSGAYGIQVLDSMQDTLMDAFSTDGQNFLVKCNSATLISLYPRISSIRLDKSNNNWVQTTPYVIEMEAEGESYSGTVFIDSAQESWNVEFDDSSSVYNWGYNGTGDNNTILVRLTHTVAAKGIPHYSGGVLTRTPWQHAQQFVISRLGYDQTMVAQSGVLNINTANFTGYNHFRTVQVDELAGSYSVTENWVAANFSDGSNAGRAIEDFTVTVKQSLEDGLTYVDINGNIQGVETRTYGSTPNSFAITETKYAAASGYWENVRPKLFGRSQLASNAIVGLSLNAIPLSYSVGLNPTKGSINYGYSYNSRACNFITGALVENITISDSLPVDIFAKIVILGRASGPIFQNLNTVSESQRTVNIELVMGAMTGCGSPSLLLSSKPTSQVNSLLCSLQSELEGENTQLMKTQDTDSWNPKQGRYTRTVSWQWVSCTGNVSTDFCE